MPKSFTAQVSDWVKKTDRVLETVLNQSANDVFKLASRTATSVTRGGSIKAGHVPRDIGTLIASQVSSLNGARIGAGENAYTMSIAGLELGDVAGIGWTAEYARAVHYRGWLWVDTAASQWPSIVAANAAKAKAIMS